MRIIDHLGNTTTHEQQKQEGFQDTVTKTTHVRNLGHGFTQKTVYYQVSERDFLKLTEKNELKSVLQDFKDSMKRLLD